MRIITLGTSHGDMTYCRFNSSTLFDISGSYYLVDCGAPANGLMTRKGLDCTKIKGIFNTHMHLDHIGGLPTTLYAITRYPVENQHTDVFLAEDGTKELTEYMRSMHLKPKPEYISFHIVSEGVIFEDQNIKVTAFGTDHIAKTGDKPITFALLIEAEGKRILCSGDLRNDFSDFPEKVGDLDILFCEATHYKPETALPVLMKEDTQQLIFYHIHDPWHGEGEYKLLDIYKDLPYPVRIAHDGDEFII